MHPLLLALVYQYLDPLQLERFLDQLSPQEQQVARQLTLHFILSRLLLSICSTTDQASRQKLWQILQKPSSTVVQLQDWLDNHIDECRLVLADSVKKSLFSLQQQ